MTQWRFAFALSVAVAAVPSTLPTIRAQRQELATTVRDGFTMAAVGDLILAYPQSVNPDPRFRGVVTLLQAADVATGNYEGNIIDGRSFQGSGGSGFAGTPDVARDLKALGTQLVSRANNHAGEYGFEGMRETNRWLDEAGVVFAGAGDTYWAARSARFVATPRGRVGLVALASSYPEAHMAQPGRGEWLGRGGVSALRTVRYFMSPPALFQAARTIRGGFPNGTGWYVRGADTATDVTVLGENFRLDPNAAQPYYHFEMNDQDLRDIVAAVREGKQRSDFLALSIHAHHFRDARGGPRGGTLADTDDLDTNPSIANYLTDLAHAAIDNGADAFLGTGVHVLRGIEIYKGRPIFYGLGEFFRQMDIIGLSGMGERARGEANSPPIKYESVIATVRVTGGLLAEVRLQPVTLTDEVPISQRGLPQIASPEASARILARLQRLSAPLGTTITIEGNVGLIRLASAATRP